MPTLNWLGKDKVVNYDAHVPFHVLNKKYNFGGTSQNKIIHGDNLLALKSLLPIYEGKIKCIYIDPPYNTGNENWIYNDNVNSPQIQKWLGQVVGREGEDYTRHDKWLCMMYPRLKLLKRLLSEDGAIFIQIDENEIYDLKFICDEIFGDYNYINTIVWKRRGGSANPSNRLNNVTDFILWYSKIPYGKIKQVFSLEDENTKKYIKERFRYTDENGRVYMKSPIQSPNPRPNLMYEYKGYRIPTKGWSISKEVMEKWDAEGRLAFPDDKSKTINRKIFLDEYKGQPVNNLWTDISVINPMSNERLDFEGQKPVGLIERILKFGTDKNSIVLDSFAGSGTTAHAVLNLNKEDGGNRKFILVEMEDYAKNITAERIKRIGGSFDFYEVGEKVFIDDEINPDLDAEKLREYIWQTDTHSEYIKQDDENFLGIHKDTAYYLTECLDDEFLGKIKARADFFVVYAEACAVDKEFLYEQKIEFRKVTRDIMRYEFADF